MPPLLPGTLRLTSADGLALEVAAGTPLPAERTAKHRHGLLLRRSGPLELVYSPPRASAHERAVSRSLPWDGTPASGRDSGHQRVGEPASRRLSWRSASTGRSCTARPGRAAATTPAARRRGVDTRRDDRGARLRVRRAGASGEPAHRHALRCLREGVHDAVSITPATREWTSSTAEKCPR